MPQYLKHTAIAMYMYIRIIHICMHTMIIAMYSYINYIATHPVWFSTLYLAIMCTQVCFSNS